MRDSTTDLRTIRESTGQSMKAIADASHTPYRTWQDWETGRRRVPGIAVAWLKLYAARQVSNTQSTTE